MKNKKTTIGIIGLTRFGTLAASILSKHFEVFAHHYRGGEDVSERAKKAGVELVDFKKAVEQDIVILAVPIAKTEDNIKNAAKYAKKGALILDVCSVKTDPCRWLKKYIGKNIDIMGTHPMLGPNSTNFDLDKQTWILDGLQIVLCPLRINKKRLGKIKEFLKSLKLEVIESTPEEHDRQTAMTLSLVHFLGRSLWEAGVRDQEIYTPGFKKVTSIFKHTVNDSWGLFYDMHNFNPYTEEIRERFINACHKIDWKIIENSDGNRFLSLRKGLDRIDKAIIKLLAERFEYVKEIGKIKQEKGMSMVDRKREREIIESKVKNSGLDSEFIEKLFRLIFDQSYKIQKPKKH